jgi:hypothetical protein
MIVPCSRRAPGVVLVVVAALRTLLADWEQSLLAEGVPSAEAAI